MRFENVSILGTAYVDAPHRITTDEIQDQLEPVLERFRTPKTLLKDLTGIEARRVWDEGAQLYKVAALSAKKVIEETGIDPNKIGVLINTSVDRDYLEPSTASMVHGELALSPHSMNFDICNACLGFVNGMQVVANMIELGQIEYGIVVNGERARAVIEGTIARILDPNCDIKTFRQQFASLTLGSSSVSMILARADLAPDGHRVKGAISMSATEHSHLCKANRDEMITDQKGLLEGGINLTYKMRDKMIEEYGADPDDFDEIAIHQVSKRHTHEVTIAAQINEEKIYRIYPEYGNIGPAGVPVVMAKAYEAGRIERGDRVGLFGIGSGLNSTVMELEW